MIPSTKPIFWMTMFALLLSLMMGCTGMESQEQQTNSATTNSAYELASDEYSDLAEEALSHLADLDIDAWGEMLADDVTYYFPDGDSGTRTVLTGKEEVINWWQNWKENSGIESMTFTEPVFLPVIANRTLNYSGLEGVFVISYFSNEMVFNGNPVRLRMNYVSFFNDENLIYRYYSYYDRTPIIEAMNENILAPETE